MLDMKVLVGNDIIGAAQVEIRQDNKIWCRAIRLKSDQMHKFSTTKYLMVKAQSQPLQFECDSLKIVNVWLSSMNYCYAAADWILAQDLTLEYEKQENK